MAKNNKNIKRRKFKSSEFFVSQNKFSTSRTFRKKMKWYDYKGMFFIFPSVMYEKNIDLDVETKVNRLVIAIGYHRWSYDFGTYTPIPDKKEWDRKGVDNFINWAKLKTGEKWTSQDIVELMGNDEYMKRLISVVGIEKHYVKTMVLKELTSHREEMMEKELDKINPKNKNDINEMLITLGQVIK